MRKFLITGMVGGLMVASAMLMPAHADGGTVPGVATVDATGDPGTASGYAVVQGEGSETPVSGGYIGVEGSAAAKGGSVVGCADGRYAPGGDNNVVTAVPPAGVPALAAPSGDCTPSAP